MSHEKPLNGVLLLGGHYGYSSLIYEVAKMINKNRELKNDIRLSLIKGTSEKIYEIYQNEVLEAFGKRIVSEYGSAEGGIIAF